jgi:hypothetical protein
MAEQSSMYVVLAGDSMLKCMTPFCLTVFAPQVAAGSAGVSQARSGLVSKQGSNVRCQKSGMTP